MLGSGSEGFALLKEMRVCVGQRMFLYLKISLSTVSQPASLKS